MRAIKNMPTLTNLLSCDELDIIHINTSGDIVPRTTIDDERIASIEHNVTFIIDRETQYGKLTAYVWKTKRINRLNEHSVYICATVFNEGCNIKESGDIVLKETNGKLFRIN